VDPVLPVTEALRSPPEKIIRKAHAVWREHFADYSFSGSLIEISQVSVTRTIAKCYVRILKICRYSLIFLLWYLCLFLFVFANIVSLIVYPFISGK